MIWQDEGGQLHHNCAVFFKVDEEFGALSNMAGGCPLRLGRLLIPSSEALYQACRFPHQPDWQREIIAQASPMAAKMMAKKGGRRRDHSRSDWEQVEEPVMRWVLRAKLALHFRRVAALLRSTGDRPVVERSRKDRSWGAVEEKDGRLHGQNRLGRMLMELRDIVLDRPAEECTIVKPPAVANVLLLGEAIGEVRGATPAP